MQTLLERAHSPQEVFQPFIETDKACLYLGNAVDTMNCIPEECVDMIFADPPYNLSNGGMTCHAGKRVSVNKAAWDVSRGINEDFAFHMDWIQACRRVLKPSGTISTGKRLKFSRHGFISRTIKKIQFPRFLGWQPFMCRRKTFHFYPTLDE